jgi:predicted nucleic acid-binding protein
LIVLDASAAVDWLLQTSAGQRIERRIYSNSESLHTPHLLDLEVTQALRRLVREGAVPARRGDEAIRDLLDLRIARYPHSVLLPRIWQLRRNFPPMMQPMLCSPRNSALPWLRVTAASHQLPAMRRTSNCFKCDVATGHPYPQVFTHLCWQERLSTLGRSRRYCITGVC